MTVVVHFEEIDSGERRSIFAENFKEIEKHWNSDHWVLKGYGEQEYHQQE